MVTVSGITYLGSPPVFKTLFNLNAEFEELPDAVQHDLMNRNGPRGLALTVARYEAATTDWIRDQSHKTDFAITKQL